MKWIRNYDLFLFDFDGLLVNTEELHFAAYKQMCRARGFHLEWDLGAFFRAAHFDSQGLKNGIYQTFPELYAQEPKWEVLYAEKKTAYQQILEQGDVKLLPGVEGLLSSLEGADIRRCVVTNSPGVQIEAIKEKLPLLHSIPLWVTREYYKNPKPDPESYKKAIEMIGRPGDRIIGFEDSTRGLTALLRAGVKDAVLVCPLDHPQMGDPLPEGVRHFNSIVDLH